MIVAMHSERDGSWRTTYRLAGLVLARAEGSARPRLGGAGEIEALERAKP